LLESVKNAAGQFHGQAKKQQNQPQKSNKKTPLKYSVF